MKKKKKIKKKDKEIKIKKIKINPFKKVCAAAPVRLHHVA